MPLLLAHFLCADVGLVVVAAEVQETVDDVERQLCLNVVAANRGLGLRNFGADDQFTGEPFGLGFAEGKTQNVRRFIVLQIALVQLLNR